MFTLSVVLFLSCVVGLSVGFWPNEKEIPECGPNEVLKQCVGCPSEDSCYDRNHICFRVLFLGCDPGCVCKEGFIRKTLSSECIPKEECAPCDELEEYTECKESLNETCSSIVSPTKTNSASEEVCTPGCGCMDGYYRADEKSPCQYKCSCPELRDTPECAS